MRRTLFLEEVRTQLARNAAVLGVGTLAFTGLLGLWWLLADIRVMAVLLQVGALLALVLTPVAVLAQVAVEYWQSLYGERGYLTHLVPVRGRTLFATKVLYACLVALAVAAAAAVGMLAWGAALARSAGVPLTQLLAPLRSMVQHMGAGTTAFLVLATVIGLLATVVELAAVMSLGAQSRFSHLGFKAPLLGFVLLYVVNEVLGLLAASLVPLSVDLTTKRLTAQWMLPQLVEAVRTGAEPRVIGVGAVLVAPLLAGVLSWWAVRAVEHHTSLR